MSERSDCSRISGIAGEDAVCSFLEGAGYRILQRNYRAGPYEIDIIAEDDRYFVFAEVKTRRGCGGSSVFGTPSQAVDKPKREALVKGAEHFMKENRTGKLYRFDVVEVLICAERDTGEGYYRFNHMKGVFGAGGKLL